MTSSFNSDTLLGVNAHPFFKSSVYVKYESNRAKWRVYIYALKKEFVHIWPWPLTYTSFMVTAHPLNKGILWVKFVPDWTKGREDMLWARIFHIILLVLPASTKNMDQSHCTPFIPRDSVGEVWSRLGQRDTPRWYAPDKRSQTDRWVEGQTDKLITIGQLQSRSLVDVKLHLYYSIECSWPLINSKIFS